MSRVANARHMGLDVYFDDVAVTFTPSMVVGVNEYFPFGLKFNAFQREGQLENSYAFGSKELQSELELNWLDFGSRIYMSDLGRWGSVDVAAELTFNWTPYRFGYDNPIRFTDYDGKTEVERIQAVARARWYMEECGGWEYQAYINDCATIVADAIVAGLGGNDWRHVGNGLGMKEPNGVAMIVGNSREIDVMEARRGDLVTFRTDRKVHKGEDGEFDHVGLVSDVLTDSKGNVIGYMVIHTSNGGTQEVEYFFGKKSWMKLRTAWQWDTPDPISKTNGPQAPKKNAFGPPGYTNKNRGKVIDNKKDSRSAYESDDFLRWYNAPVFVTDEKEKDKKKK